MTVIANIGPSIVITDTDVVPIKRTLTPQYSRFSRASVVAIRSSSYSDFYRSDGILTRTIVRSRADSFVTIVKPTRAKGIGRTR